MLRFKPLAQRIFAAAVIVLSFSSQATSQSKTPAGQTENLYIRVLACMATVSGGENPVIP
jgi:hypothetical protein